MRRYKTKVDFYLPIEQAVYVPSTTKGDRSVSSATFKKRVNDVRSYMSKKFGGYTSVEAVGGYYSNDKKKLIKEKVVKVTSFGEKQKYKESRSELMSRLGAWQRSWKQESIGYEKEGDLMYVKSTKALNIRRKPRRVAKDRPPLVSVGLEGGKGIFEWK